MDIELIKKELLEELTAEFKSDPAFKEEIIAIKIKDAIRKVKEKRSYQYSGLSASEINTDLYENYFSTIKDLASFYYNKKGGEYQQSHSENGIYRTWISEDSILKNIHSYVKVIF